MELILRACRESFKSFLWPRVWLLVLLPPLLTLVVWAGSLVIVWSKLSSLVDVWMVSPKMIESYFSFAGDFFYAALPLLRILWIAALCFLLLGLIFATALLVTSAIIVPILLKTIQQRDYPHLQKVGKTHFLKSIVHAITATLEVAFIFVLSIPLWLLPGASVVISGFLTGYLGARIFPYEILSEYASEEELKTILKKYKINFIAVGMVAFLANFFPLAFLISPVFTALVFIYLCFDLLERERRLDNN